MRVKVYSRHGAIGFVLIAETDVDKAILACCTEPGRELTLGGYTYKDSEVTDLNLSFRRGSP